MHPPGWEDRGLDQHDHEIHQRPLARHDMSNPGLVHVEQRDRLHVDRRTLGSGERQSHAWSAGKVSAIPAASVVGHCQHKALVKVKIIYERLAADESHVHYWTNETILLVSRNDGAALCLGNSREVGPTPTANRCCRCGGQLLGAQVGAH